MAREARARRERSEHTVYAGSVGHMYVCPSVRPSVRPVQGCISANSQWIFKRSSAFDRESKVIRVFSSFDEEGNIRWIT